MVQLNVFFHAGFLWFIARRAGKSTISRMIFSTSFPCRRLGFPVGRSLGHFEEIEVGIIVVTESVHACDPRERAGDFLLFGGILHTAARSAETGFLP